MSRNKFPEETVRKILDVSYRLFLRKGYDQTSIQDIVDGLGMSKGAIYHHFKNKEEILSAISELYYNQSNWVENIRDNPNINALQKIRELFLFELCDENKLKIDALSLPLLKNYRMLAEQVEGTVLYTAPIIAQILEEGMADGSIQVRQPREAAEVLVLLVNIWTNPGIFPTSRERYLQKISYYQSLTNQMGIPFLDDTLMQAFEQYYDIVLYAADLAENDQVRSKEKGAL